MVCVFQDMEHPKSSSILRKSSNIRKPIRCVWFTKAVVRHADIRNQSPSLGFAQVILISATQCPINLRIGLMKRTERQERDAREAAWRLAKNIPNFKEKHKNSILLTLGELVSTFAINPQTRGKRICCGLWFVNAHDQQKRLEFCWNGYFDDIEKSDDGKNSQWWSADAWRGHSVRQRIGYILDYETPRKHASSIVARKALRWKRIFLRMDQRSKTDEYSCDENIS